MGSSSRLDSVCHETASNADFNTKQTGILVLTGPSGCGKTATIQLLCSTLGMTIIEWINPVYLNQFGM